MLPELLATNVSRIWRNVLILNMWKISRAAAVVAAQEMADGRANNENEDEDA